MKIVLHCARSSMEVEPENIVLLVVFILLVGLVYICGFIVWVWCRKSRLVFKSSRSVTVPTTNQSEHALLLMLMTSVICNKKNNCKQCKVSR